MEESLEIPFVYSVSVYDGNVYFHYRLHKHDVRSILVSFIMIFDIWSFDSIKVCLGTDFIDIHFANIGLKKNIQYLNNSWTKDYLRKMRLKTGWLFGHFSWLVHFHPSKRPSMKLLQI